MPGTVRVSHLSIFSPYHNTWLMEHCSEGQTLAQATLVLAKRETTTLRDIMDADQ
jgi:type VI protein secretion system component Hcp